MPKTAANRAVGSDYCIKHICRAGVAMSKLTAICFGGKEEPGPTHGRWCASPEDERPSLFLALPVGCLIEEVLLVEGEPRLQTTDKTRLELLKLSVYHVDAARLKAARDALPGEHHVALRQVTVDNPHEHPVWSGGMTMSGARAGVANLRKWAAARRDRAAAERHLAPELVGGVGYGNGEVGNVHVAGGDVLTHTGVIGNVLHIEAPDPRIYGNERFEPTATFAIAGITQ